MQPEYMTDCGCKENKISVFTPSLTHPSAYFAEVATKAERGRAGWEWEGDKNDTG